MRLQRSPFVRVRSSVCRQKQIVAVLPRLPLRQFVLVLPLERHHRRVRDAALETRLLTVFISELTAHMQAQVAAEVVEEGDGTEGDSTEGDGTALRVSSTGSPPRGGQTVSMAGGEVNRHRPKRAGTSITSNANTCSTERTSSKFFR